MRGALCGSRSDAGPPRPAKARVHHDRIMANGVTEGQGREVPLRPEIPGQIAAIHFSDNQDVAAGAIIAELQNDVQTAQLAQAEAEVEVAQAEFDRANNNWTRAQRLLSRAAGSREETDEHYFNMKSAQGRLASARASAQLARARLDQTYIKAPRAGRVLTVEAEVGQQAGPATHKPLVIFADLSRRRVRAFVEELDAFKVQPGLPARITIDGLPDKEYTGTVAVVVPRMGDDSVRSNVPGEYRDLYYREVLIDIEKGEDLPTNLRVRAWIDTKPEEVK
ncbi:MAG: efflux RND transporter periplasmic adaptor subunit [Gemmataceae bacterium]